MESALHSLLMMEDYGAGNAGLRDKLLSLKKNWPRISFIWPFSAR